MEIRENETRNTMQRDRAYKGGGDWKREGEREDAKEYLGIMVVFTIVLCETFAD